MLSHKLKSIHAALGDILPRIDADSAEIVRACRRNLEDGADIATTLETIFVAPSVASADRPALISDGVMGVHHG